MVRRWFWMSFSTLFFIGGCGGDDGDPGTSSAGGSGATGGAASGGTSGSGATGGGSGGTAGGGNVGGTLGGSGGVAGSGNLGGSAGGGGIGGALNDACYEMCDQEEKGQNCLPELTQVCKDGCNAVTPGVEAKCPEVAKAYYDCNASIDYVCILGLATPKDQNACKAEATAMNACTGA